MNPGWQTFLFEYHHDGSQWTIEIPATSEEDAIERLNKLPLARYIGTLEMKVPVQLGLFARFFCWYRNRVANGRSA
jgi:hypothetical protein